MTPVARHCLSLFSTSQVPNWVLRGEAKLTLRNYELSHLFASDFVTSHQK